MKRVLLLASLVSFSLISYAEISETILYGKRAENAVKKSEVVRLKSFTNFPNYVKFKKGAELPFTKLTEWLKQFQNSESEFGLNLIKMETGLLGMQHYRYQQTFNNVPVEMSMFLAHVENGFVKSVNGELFSEINTNTTPSITESAALAKALQYMGATLYKWEDKAEEDHLKWEQNNSAATYYPKGKLVLVNKDGNIEADMVLAYKFNIYAKEPLARKEVFVNAKTGEVVWEKNLIHEADVTGSATTLYSGTQTITCDHTGGNNHRLRETGRGNGVRTFTNNNTTNYSNTDITHNSNNWNINEAGIDAHWGAEMTYDYYLNFHGRNSIDGNGFQLNSYVHHNNNYSNAFWDGSRMTYGDGNGNNTPFTAIDIAGHEVTHGLISNTANLVYQAESGALNESFADIFGISIDMINRPGHPNADWVLGDDLGFVIRNMANPHAAGDPHTYFGTNWASLTGPDNGGVHTNSGVQNFWYVLLVDGGIGTNDNNDSYNITSIGMTKAAQVAFRNLTIYLTQNSGFSDARFYGIQSAIDLFGPCSFEVEQVTNAWYAVGVGQPYVAGVVSDFDAPSVSSCVVPFTVNFNNTSVNGTNYTWDFGDGSPLDTNNNPTHSYTANGTYTVQLIADGGACGIDTVVKTAYISVNTPPAPTTTDDNICENSTATLLASGTGTLDWYNNATGGTSFFTGASYTTPPLSNTTTYYVENVIAGATGNLGKLDNTGGGNNFNNFQYLIFDVYQPMELVSVEVYPGASGNRTIELRDSQGTPLQSTTVNIPNVAGPHTVNLNFMINPGTDYQLGVSNSSNIDLYRNNNGTNYPYTLSGIASITRSSAGSNPVGYYYFFYNWTVKEADCVSQRQPVTANVNVCTGVNDIAENSLVKAYYNAGGNIQLDMTGIELGNYNLSVINSIGQTVEMRNINVSSDVQSELINMNGKAKGMYIVNLVSANNTYSVKLVK